MLIYQLAPSDLTISLPVGLGRYRCLLLIRRPVGDRFRAEVSQLLVETGCLYAMAWGQDCSLWDDSVDNANIEKFSPADIPADQFVMTTWHDHDSLEDVLSFAKFSATSSFGGETLENIGSRLLRYS